MLHHFLFILLGISVGDAITASLSLPVPGSVLGLLAAAAFFAARGGPTPAMSGMFDAVIPFAPMLFVPAGAGVVANLDLIAANWLPIVGVITLGTAVAMVATGLAAQIILQRLRRQEAA